MKAKSEETYAVIRNFIDEYYMYNHKSPSVREIEAGTGIARMTVQRYLTAMKECGEIAYNGRRGIETEFSQSIWDVAPAMRYESTVSCGAPTESEANFGEIIPLPKAIVGEGEFFILTAVGGSMIDIGVEEGDLLIVKRQNTFLDGELVIALVNGTETVFKRIYRDNGNGFVLHAENKTYEGEELNRHVSDVSVQGIVIKVLKNLK